MGHTITIGEGADQLALSANIRFDIKALKNMSAGGDDVESVDVTVEIEGVIRDTSPATVSSSIFSYLQQVTDNFDTVRVLIEQDGTDRLDLKPETSFIGPHVIAFSTMRSEEGGTGEGHWRYSFTVVCKTKGNVSEDNDSVYELHRSLAITRKNGKVVRKVWKITARSTSWESALSAVESFRPSEKYITEELEPFYDEKRATGVWVWEAESAGVLSWKCKVTASMGRVGFVGRGRAGKDADGVLYLKRRMPLRIEIVGQIISLDPRVAAPSAHYSQSATMFRATEEEFDFGVAEIHDQKRGEYLLDYNEVWYSTGPTEKPSHSGDHHLINTGLAPSNGNIEG